MPGGYVYILASRYRGTLYTGCTIDLVRRVWEHRERVRPDCFTARYNVDRLVFLEPHDTLAEAVAREYRVKRYRREWKFALVETTNSGWRDLWWELAH